jgi:hypothetical protein
MKFNRPRCKVEMLSASGVLRVIITPQINVFVVLEIAVFAAILIGGWREWTKFYVEQPLFSILFGGSFALSLLGAIWYQIAGSEEIEFRQTGVLIRKDRPLRTKQYELSLKECTQLQVHDPGEGESDRLQCLARGERLTLGADLTEDQAINILVELQRALPDAADQLLNLGGADAFGKHFTTLKLS